MLKIAQRARTYPPSPRVAESVDSVNGRWGEGRNMQVCVPRYNESTD